MICTFCGTENPSGNRFCGMCGVRLERRKLERRVDQGGITTCPECNNVNETKFKFCGMCGAQIDRRTNERRGSSAPSRAHADANVRLPTPDLHRQVPRVAQETARGSGVLAATAQADPESPRPRAASRHHPQEVVSGLAGPSFLGLSDPPNTDYLLEEERTPHRGLRALLLLVVLAAIVGLIFVQYRSSMNNNQRSPQPPNPAPATVPRSEGSSRPVQDNGLRVAVAAHSLQPAVASVAKAASLSLNNHDTNVAKKGADEADSPRSRAEAAVKTDSAGSTDDQPSPALMKAQKLLHGRGVRQNCEQGLIYLRAAARENDPQAAVQMGALYSSGLCVTQDRVKAYEWFSTARDMQPDNRWISRNLTELWAKMSLQERRQIHP